MSAKDNGMMTDIFMAAATGAMASTTNTQGQRFREKKYGTLPDAATVSRENEVRNNAFKHVNVELSDSSRRGPVWQMSKEIIESYIRRVHYFNLNDIYKASGIRTDEIPVVAKSMTLCHIVTTTGAIFTGESTILDIRNYDIELGKKSSYDKAFNKLADYLSVKYRDMNFEETAQEVGRF